MNHLSFLLDHFPLNTKGISLGVDKLLSKIVCLMRPIHIANLSEKSISKEEMEQHSSRALNGNMEIFVFCFSYHRNFGYHPRSRLNSMHHQ